MAKRIKPGMRDLAEQLGAIQGNRPDWYRVAEHLAQIARPDLLKDPPVSRPVGRPKRNYVWLLYDVDLVRAQRNCTIKEACARLAKGECPHRVSVRMPDGSRRWGRGAMGLWKGKSAKRLEVDYQRARQEWRQTRERLETQNFLITKIRGGYIRNFESANSSMQCPDTLIGRHQEGVACKRFDPRPSGI
jgi:hypothetical protein